MISLLRAPVTALLDTLPEDCTFEGLKERLLARYGMRKTTEQYEMELRRFTLNKQENFYGQLLRLQDLVARSSPNECAARQEELTLSYFSNLLKNLDFSFFTIFGLKNFKTVAEAGAYLLDCFRFEPQMVSTQTNSRRDLICCSCGQFGHMAQFCRNNRVRQMSENFDRLPRM